jgi:predicted enzyme related to lactoylglutathione lyase
METTKAIFKNAWPYQQDKMNLPVNDVESATLFYETKMGFKVLSQKSEPHKMAVLERNNVQIGIVENGGDPTQDGCFFEVDNVAAVLE